MVIIIVSMLLYLIRYLTQGKHLSASYLPATPLSQRGTNTDLALLIRGYATPSAMQHKLVECPQLRAS